MERDNGIRDTRGGFRVEVQGTSTHKDRILTIPNLLSMARLAGVPVFLWLILSPEFGGPTLDGWALAVLAASGVSDYLDGKLARRWNQVSELGRILDPAAVHPTGDPAHGHTWNEKVVHSLDRPYDEHIAHE